MRPLIKPLNLYEIADALAAILSAADDADAELSDADAANLDALGMTFEHKASSICGLVAHYDAQADAYKKHAALLAQRAATAERRVTWLKNWLKISMERAGLTKLQAGLHKLSVVKNSRPSIALAIGAEIPEGFEKIVRTFDGQKAYEAWKAGAELPGVVEVKVGNHLRGI